MLTHTSITSNISAVFVILFILLNYWFLPRKNNYFNRINKPKDNNFAKNWHTPICINYDQARTSPKFWLGLYH